MKSAVIALAFISFLGACQEDGGGGDNGSGGAAISSGVPAAAPNPVTSTGDSAEERLAAFNLVIETYCESCHNTASIGDFTALSTDDDWASSRFVTAGNLDQSTIYTRLKNVGGDMPQGPQQLTDAEVEIVRVYIVNWGKESGAEAPAAAESTISLSGPPTFDDFQSVIQEYCLGCHNSSLNGNFATLTSAQAWMDSRFLSPGNPDQSSVYTRLKNAGGDMPQNSRTLSSGEAKIIEDYIESLQAEATLFLGSSPRLAPRSYVKSVLENIFGSGVQFDGNDIINENVLQRLNEFNGACDIHGSRIDRSGDPAEYLDEWCYANRSANKERPFGVTNPVRNGWLTNACEQFTSVDSAVTYAVETRLSLSSPYPAPSTSNISGAYQLFYPGQSMPNGFRDALLAVSAQASDDLDRWRWTLLALCLSAEWQVP